MTKKHLLGGIAALLLMAGTAAAYDPWDFNMDGKIDRSEIGAGFGGADTHEKWRKSAKWRKSWNGRIQREEFARQYNGDSDQYTGWDPNAGGSVERDEIGSRLYTQYDIDHDGFLNETETRELQKNLN